MRRVGVLMSVAADDPEGPVRAGGSVSARAATIGLERWRQGERMRRVGVLMSVSDDPEGPVRAGALAHGLQQLGWSVWQTADRLPLWGAGRW